MRLGIKHWICALTLGVVPAALANSGGAPPGSTGAPGEVTCVACHGGSPNTGSGNVAINAGGASYTPGETKRIVVTITDGSARRWGFQLSARRTNGNAQAGTIATANANAQILTDGGVQYITHTSAGTRRGTTGPVTFEFDWVAPAAGTGEVTFFVAANAANNNGTNDPGDSIYTSSTKLPEATGSGTAPTIRTEQPALQAFGGRTDFSANSYLEIYGTNLSTTTRQWAGSDFSGSNAPTSLDGVSVMVNGKPAFVYYISPTQININTPEDTATGPVSIQVKNAAGDSNTVMVNKARLSPAMLTTPAFNVSSKQYVVALHPSSTSTSTVFVGRPGLVSGANFQTVRAGDIILVYALGCGPTNPATAAGVVAAANAPLSSPFQVRIGGQTATVNFAGVVAGSIGLYQLNVVVPNIGAGDQNIELTVDGVAAQTLVLSNE